MARMTATACGDEVWIRRVLTASRPFCKHRCLHLLGLPPKLRRGRYRGSTAQVPPKLRRRIIREYGQTCQYCGRRGARRLGPGGEPWHIDHIVPVARGGKTTPENLTLACKRCNLKKGTELWEPFCR